VQREGQRHCPPEGASRSSSPRAPPCAHIGGLFPHHSRGRSCAVAASLVVVSTGSVTNLSSSPSMRLRWSPAPASRFGHEAIPV
jgi:hypothetical protein